jgi:hypothetical protein
LAPELRVDGAVDVRRQLPLLRHEAALGHLWGVLVRLVVVWRARPVSCRRRCCARGAALWRARLAPLCGEERERERVEGERRKLKADAAVVVFQAFAVV